MHVTKNVQNNVLHNFGHVHFRAVITNWRAKVGKLSDAPLEHPPPLIISE